MVAGLRAREAWGGSAAARAERGSSTRVSPAFEGARAAAAGGSLSGRMVAKSTSARCSWGVIILRPPRGSCLTTRASSTIMITPTMARRALTARSTTAARESPRSCTRKGGPPVPENASMASRTALCSSGPMELSLSHSKSPCASCNEMAWARAGSRAARTFWQTASKSTSGPSAALSGLPCSIDPLL